jgi:chaperonin GroES
MVFLGFLFSNHFTEVLVMAEATLTDVKVAPLGDRVLVRPNDKEESRKSGLIIPETAKEKPQYGTVVATGKGKMTDEGKVIPMDVKKGDKILYGKYSGTEIKIDDVEYLIMHQEDILGILS